MIVSMLTEHISRITGVVINFVRPRATFHRCYCRRKGLIREVTSGKSVSRSDTNDLDKKKK